MSRTRRAPPAPSPRTRAHASRAALAVLAIAGVAASMAAGCGRTEPAATPAPAPATSTAPPAREVDPPPIVNPPITRDLKALLAAPPRSRCRPHQVASGVWVRFHCGAFDAVKSTRKADPAKLHMLRRGRLRLDDAVGKAAVDTDAAVSDETWHEVLPHYVDHRKAGTEGPVMSQGQVGCCSAFSLASSLNNAIRRQDKTDAISPMHIWSHYFTPGMASAGEKNDKRALAVVSVWPYDEALACKISQDEDGCETYYHVQKERPPWEPLLAQKVSDADAHGTWQMTSVTCVSGAMCQSDKPSGGGDAAVVAAYLATGADLWAAMWIDEQAWYHPASGAIPDYTIPPEAITSGTGEGHSVTFTGYDWRGGTLRFLVKNSWGEGWGDKGYAWISQAMVEKYLQEAYKVTVLDLVSPPAPPGSPHALTDDDCPEDELVDSVTGRCAAICPGEVRPANGACK